MLETSCLSNVAQLICADPEFKWFVLRVRDYDAMFRAIIVHSVELLYSTPGTGH